MSPAIGIILGLFASISINAGNNLQSLGMRESKKLGEDSKPRNSKYWVLGTVIFVLGGLTNFASYGFAPQTTLASLESIQFVTNLFFNKYLLDQEITHKMMLGTAFTVCGTVMAVMFSSKKSAEMNVVDDLIQLWNNIYWICYIVIISALALALQCVYRELEKKHTWPKVNKFKNIMSIIYSIFSAIFGTLSVVFAKLLANLLNFQAGGINIFTEWFTYVTLFSWLFLMLFWLYRLNAALALYNPLIIIPLLQGNFIFYAIVSGGIYFQEFKYMTLWNWIWFIIGILCMFSGLFLMIPHIEEIDAREFLNLGEKPSVRNLMKRATSVSVLLVTGPTRMNDALKRKSSSDPGNTSTCDLSRITLDELMPRLPKDMMNVNSVKIEKQKLLEVHGGDIHLKGQTQTSDELKAGTKKSESGCNMELKKPTSTRHKPSKL